MALPLLPVAQGLFGLGQALFSGKRKAEKKLEALQTPTYTQNKGIMDFYNTALQRYNTSPYQTTGYQTDINNINRGVATGLNALQGRRSAVGGVSRLFALQNDATLRAGAKAEQEQNQRFSQLGNATNMRLQDDLRAFQYNKLAPYEKQFGLLASKASGANKTLGAGLQNIFGGLQGIQDYNTIQDIYSRENGGGAGATMSYANSGYGRGITNTNYLNKYGGFRDLYR